MLSHNAAGLERSDRHAIAMMASTGKEPNTIFRTLYRPVLCMTHLFFHVESGTGKTQQDEVNHPANIEPHDNDREFGRICRPVGKLCENSGKESLSQNEPTSGRGRS